MDNRVALLGSYWDYPSGRELYFRGSERTGQGMGQWAPSPYIPWVVTHGPLNQARSAKPEVITVARTGPTVSFRPWVAYGAWVVGAGRELAGDGWPVRVCDGWHPGACAYCTLVPGLLSTVPSRSNGAMTRAQKRETRIPSESLPIFVRTPAQPASVASSPNGDRKLRPSGHPNPAAGFCSLLQTTVMNRVTMNKKIGFNWAAAQRSASGAVACSFSLSATQYQKWRVLVGQD